MQGETRTNLSVVDTNHTHYFKVNEPGAHVSDIEATAMLNKISSLVRNGEWWVIAGSIPPEIQASFITEIVQRIQQAGAYAILDMDGDCLREGCSSNVFLVKPNAKEAGELNGTAD